MIHFVCPMFFIYMPIQDWHTFIFILSQKLITFTGEMLQLWFIFFSRKICLIFKIFVVCWITSSGGKSQSIFIIFHSFIHCLLRLVFDNNKNHSRENCRYSMSVKVTQLTTWEFLEKKKNTRKILQIRMDMV